uniref:Ribosomal protein S11 n=1 Tax=Strongyloides venezuelensis TaxID=75913 RepID=A0A0K0FIX5_STRVS
MINLTSQTVIVPYFLRLSKRSVRYEYNGHLYKTVNGFLANFLIKTGIKNPMDVCIYNAGIKSRRNVFYSKSSNCQTVMHYLNHPPKPKLIKVKYSYYSILYSCGKRVFLIFEHALEFSLRKHCFIYFELPRRTKKSE